MNELKFVCNKILETVVCCRRFMNDRKQCGAPSPYNTTIYSNVYCLREEFELLPLILFVYDTTTFI